MDNRFIRLDLTLVTRDGRPIVNILTRLLPTLEFPGRKAHACSPFRHTGIPSFDFLVEAHLSKVFSDNGATLSTDVVELIADLDEGLLQFSESNQSLIDGSKCVTKATLLDQNSCDLLLSTSRFHSGHDNFLALANLSLDGINGSGYGTASVDIVDLDVEMLECSLDDCCHLTGLHKIDAKAFEIFNSEVPGIVSILLTPTSERWKYL